MKTNKEMYKEYKEALEMVKRYQYWDYIDNYKDMKREEKLYDQWCDKAYEAQQAIITQKIEKSIEVYKIVENDRLDIELGIIGKKAKDDIVLFVRGTHIYTGEEVKELGWHSNRKNGKVVYC
jgi:hypothetical protein